MINRIFVCKFFLMLFVLMSSRQVHSMSLLKDITSYKESAAIVGTVACLVGMSDIFVNASYKLEIYSKERCNTILKSYYKDKGFYLKEGTKLALCIGLPLGGIVALAARYGALPKMELSDLIKPMPCVVGLGLCSIPALLHVVSYLLEQRKKNEKPAKLGITAAFVNGFSKMVPLSMLGLAGYSVINRYRMS